MIYEIAAVAAIGIVAWYVGRRWPMSEENVGNRWRFASLATAAAVLLISIPTFGAGLLLAPLAVLMTVVSARRLTPPRGSAYWLGAMLSGSLMLVATIWIVAVIYVETTD